MFRFLCLTVGVYKPCALCYVDNKTFDRIGKVLPAKKVSHTISVAEDQKH